MGEIKVKKASLSGVGLNIEYVDELDNKVTVKGENPVHDDLRNAFRELVPYFADLTEQAETKPLDWDNPFDAKVQSVIDNLKVSSVTLKGYESNEKCVMSGTRTLSTMKVLSITSPSCGFDLANEQYPRCEDLRDAVYKVLHEAELYITEQKWGAIQQKIDFGNDDEDDNPFEEE